VRFGIDSNIGSLSIFEAFEEPQRAAIAICGKAFIKLF
jgi:hypothetical protein